MMFHFMFTPLENHFDLGFGVMGDGFRAAAEKLTKDRTFRISMTQNHLPVCYLYRHALELYLKSGLYILHKVFQLPTPTGAYDGKPVLLVNETGGTRPLQAVHSIECLYKNYVAATRSATRLIDAGIAKDPESQEFRKLKKTVTQSVGMKGTASRIMQIEAFDARSDYFRYPLSKSGTQNIDTIKSAMKPIAVDALQDLVQPSNICVYVNDNNEPVEAFVMDITEIRKVWRTLRALTWMYRGIHLMLRMELCEGQ